MRQGRVGVGHRGLTTPADVASGHLQVYERDFKVPTLDAVSVRVKATARDSGVESDWSKAWSLGEAPPPAQSHYLSAR